MAAKRNTDGDIPPQRRARTIPGRKPRQPNIKKDEKAALNEAATALAHQINGELDKLKNNASKRWTPEERRRRNAQVRRARHRRKNSGEEQPRCKGYTWKGNPCQLPPLLVEHWDGPNEPTGLYCVHHDPNITRDETESFVLHGSANRPVPRKVTPGQLAHLLVERSPHMLLKPYLKALGLDVDDDGELTTKGTGLKLYGYSRGGEVVKSAYPDLVSQVNVAEKLFDRIYGKPRQAVDLASTSSTVAVSISMDVQRVEKVTSVLAEAGALPLPNGNGQVIEGEATDLAELPETAVEDSL